MSEGAVDWLAAEGITEECNPPLNIKFCPDDFRVFVPDCLSLG